MENDNDTGWADKLSHVGSEGTDSLVKAMINIMLINSSPTTYNVSDYRYTYLQQKGREMILTLYCI